MRAGNSNIVYDGHIDLRSIDKVVLVSLLTGTEHPSQLLYVHPAGASTASCLSPAGETSSAFEAYTF